MTDSGKPRKKYTDQNEINRSQDGIIPKDRNDDRQNYNYDYAMTAECGSVT
jgi:hypothetical protein